MYSTFKHYSDENKDVTGSVWWWWLLSCFLETKPSDMWCDDISSGSQSYPGRSGCHNMCALPSLLHCLLYHVDLFRSLASLSLGRVCHTLLSLDVRTLIWVWLIVIELWKLMNKPLKTIRLSLVQATKHT